MFDFILRRILTFIVENSPSVFVDVIKGNLVMNLSTRQGTSNRFRPVDNVVDKVGEGVDELEGLRLVSAKVHVRAVGKEVLEVRCCASDILWQIF